MEKNYLTVVEDIDEIMAEMEAKTPKPADIEKSFDELFIEKVEKVEKTIVTKVPDVVDAKGFWSRNSPPKPEKPGKMYSSMPTNERYYDFTHSRVGAALIFNQMNIKGESERKGSQKDAEDLCVVLSDIGFDVKICDDYTTREIKNELNKCNTVLYLYVHQKTSLSNFIFQYQSATILITIVCLFAS